MTAGCRFGLASDVMPTTRPALSAWFPCRRAIWSCAGAVCARCGPCSRSLACHRCVHSMDTAACLCCILTHRCHAGLQRMPSGLYAVLITLMLVVCEIFPFALALGANLSSVLQRMNYRCAQRSMGGDAPARLTRRDSGAALSLACSACSTGGSWTRSRSRGSISSSYKGSTCSWRNSGSGRPAWHHQCGCARSLHRAKRVSLTPIPPRSRLAFCQLPSQGAAGPRRQGALPPSVQLSPLSRGTGACGVTLTLSLRAARAPSQLHRFQAAAARVCCLQPVLQDLRRTMPRTLLCRPTHLAGPA